MTREQAIKTAPQGTSGRVAAPWSDDEAYGVAANWTEASAPIYVVDDDNWTLHPLGKQVADYRHDVADAMLAEIQQAAGQSAVAYCAIEF